MIAVESGGDQHFTAGFRQQVARQLPLDELVVGLVAVEGLNDPIAVRRHVAQAIHGIAMGIGKTCQIQPVHRHFFPVMGRFKQAIYLLFICIGGFILLKSVNFSQGRREASQVERQTTQEDSLGGFRCRLQLFGFQFLQYKIVNGVFDPI